MPRTLEKLALPVALAPWGALPLPLWVQGFTSVNEDGGPIPLFAELTPVMKNVSLSLAAQLRSEPGRDRVQSPSSRP